MGLFSFLGSIFKRKQASTTSAPASPPPPEKPIFDLSNPFEYALAYTLKNEGGYTDDALDRGGPTNLGITIEDLCLYRKAAVTAADVKNLTTTEAKVIYKKFYWDALNLDKVQDTAISTALFDMGVLRGVGVPPKYVKTILTHYFAKDLMAVNYTDLMPELNNIPRESFIPAYKLLCDAGFKSIVAKNPTQVRFIKGWLNRSERLLTLLKAPQLNQPKRNELPNCS